MVLALVLPTAGALQLGRGWNYGNILEKSPPAKGQPINVVSAGCWYSHAPLPDLREKFPNSGKPACWQLFCRTNAFVVSFFEEYCTAR